MLKQAAAKGERLARWWNDEVGAWREAESTHSSGSAECARRLGNIGLEVGAEPVSQRTPGRQGRNIGVARGNDRGRSPRGIPSTYWLGEDP